MHERKGQSLRSISKETGHAFETMQKYAQMDDFNIKLESRQKRRGKLTPFKPFIDKWLEEDLCMPRKQRHTAKRIYDLLKEIYGDKFNASEDQDKDK